MRILNGTVFKDGRFQERITLETAGSFFSEQSGDGEELDARGCYIIPGLIDIHFHGCAGADFSDGTVDAIEAMAQYELKHGITSIHTATMTL